MFLRDFTEFENSTIQAIKNLHLKICKAVSKKLKEEKKLSNGKCFILKLIFNIQALFYKYDPLKYDQEDILYLMIKEG